MAFRHPSGWLLTASPRRRPRQPFRRTPFPRPTTSSRRGSARRAAPAAAPANAPAIPWWRALLDALAAAPAKQRAAQAQRGDRREPTEAKTSRSTAGEVHNDWRPLTERLDRQREQLTSIDGHLRRLVELQTNHADATAVYAPPA